MRYYSYNEMGDDGENLVITKSEDDIRKEYWPYWYGRMCDRFEQSYVDEHFSFEDCLDDWIVVHWAVEVKE